MPENIEVADEVAQALGGWKSTMNVPEEINNVPLGRDALDDLEVVITAAGVIAAFELTTDEIRAIMHGERQFLIHFLVDQVTPFRLIFNTMGDPNEQKNGTELRFSEPNPTPEGNDDAMHDVFPPKE